MFYVLSFHKVFYKQWTQLPKAVKTGNPWEDEKENRCSYSVTSSFHYVCNSPAGTQSFLGVGAHHRCPLVGIPTDGSAPSTVFSIEVPQKL